MRLQRLQRYPAISALRNDHSNTSQGVSKIKICDGEFISKVLDRRWTLISPDSKINQVKLSTLRTRNGDGPFGNIFFSNNSHPSLCDDMMSVNDQDPSFYVVRDDLLHPLINGNKARKLDALLPLIEDHLVTDVIILLNVKSFIEKIGVLRSLPSMTKAVRALSCHSTQLDFSASMGVCVVSLSFFSLGFLFVSKDKDS